MRFLNRFSIKNKLIIVVLLVTIMILTIGFSVVMINDIKNFRKDMVDSTNMSARLIGWSCISALAFEDKKGVQDILTRVELMPSIVNVSVYDAQDTLFGALEKKKTEFEEVFVDKKGFSRFDKGYLHCGQPIVYQNRQYGTIHLRVSTDMLDEKVKEYMITMAALIGGLLLVTYILASGLQRLISQPILKLADLTKRVSSEADYSVRVTRQSGDEIGVLYDGFNNMLKQIHHREIARERAEKELKNHRDNLEEQVIKRTAELAVAKEAAETANAAKSDFLAQMSHEIRTPLNAVTGLTQIVLKSKLTAEQRNYLVKVQLAGGNLLQVINDILDFSKVEAGQVELAHTPFDLDQVMEQLTDLFCDRVVQEDIELIFALDSNIPRHWLGDGARLTQVLINLVTNAFKFTESGEIVVRLESANQADQCPGHRALKFAVSDTGIGIAADVLPTLFEPFTQADSYLTRKHEGTGLGLAICRRLVELMGGRIWAESSPGRGSTFFFTVMLETCKHANPTLCLPADLHGLKALVVDDSATARQVLGDLLKSFKFNVSVVDSGEEAVETLCQASVDEPYQLVFLDWKMPGMDGIETARCIREMEANVENLKFNAPNPAAPSGRSVCCGPSAMGCQPTPIIILVTAYGLELLQDHIETAAVNTLLLKPVKPSLLRDAILELFGQPDAKASPRPQDPSTHLPSRFAGQRVLVAEDSELNRDVAVALLEETGLIVETASNGRIAVDRVTGSLKGYYDAVLMDIQMPEMDGYEATRRIREWEQIVEKSDDNPSTISHQPSARPKRVPILALTAHALKGEKEKCLDADMDDYLPKPIDEQALQQMLNKWIFTQ